MPYEYTDRGLATQHEVKRFMDDFIYPNEAEYNEELEQIGHDGCPPIMDKLKAASRERGLWNLFLPHLDPDAPGTKMSNLDYAPISEMLGKVTFASESLNCSAPDTGNMEILNLYASAPVKERWLSPLLEGEIRSAFSMTEPDVASSDATNIGLRIVKDGDSYVLNGRKWFSSGALNSRCKVLIVMGKTDPNASRHRQQSMIVVPKDSPASASGATPTCLASKIVAATLRSSIRTFACPRRTSSAKKAAGSRSARRAWVLAEFITACAPSAWQNAAWST